MKNRSRILTTSASALAILTLAGAQQTTGSGAPTVVIAATPFDPTLFYVIGAVILVAIVALALWLRTRKRGGSVIASSRDR